jgi:hypothetical protein
VVALGVQPCGRWSLVAFYGACGGNAMIGSLRTKKEPLRISFPFSFILCTPGQLRSSPLAFSFNDFLVLFSTSS